MPRQMLRLLLAVALGCAGLRESQVCFDKLDNVNQCPSLSEVPSPDGDNTVAGAKMMTLFCPVCDAVR